MADLALFDFDGTLTRCDSFTPFVTGLLSPARLRWGRVLLTPAILGYRAGVVSQRGIRAAVVRVGMSGMPAEHLHAAGKKYARETLPGLLRANALSRIEWHRERGDTLIVVSASLDAYLHPWCKAQRLLCVSSKLEERDGRLTGRYQGRQCAGSDKLAMVREQIELSRFDAVHAYGDTEEDRAMLDIAQHRYFRWAGLD